MWRLLLLILCIVFCFLDGFGQAARHRHAAKDTSYVLFNSGKVASGSRNFSASGAGLYRLSLVKGVSAELVAVRPVYTVIDSSKPQNLLASRKFNGYRFDVEPLVKVSVDTAAFSGEDTVRLFHFATLTDSLIGLLKKDSVLSGLYIDDLNLDSLCKNVGGKKLAIDIPLRFDHCLFGRVDYPISDSFPSAYKRLVSSGAKDSVYFLQEVVFSHCSFLADVTIESAVFEKKVSFSSVYSGVDADDFTFSNVLFQDSLLLNQESDFLPSIYQVPKDQSTLIKYIPGVVDASGYWQLFDVRLENDVFDAGVSVVNNSRLMEVKFSKASFKDRVNLTRKANYWWNTRQTQENNLFFTDCDFNKVLDLERMSLWVVYFLDCKIRDSLLLYGATIDTSLNYPLAQVWLQNKDEQTMVIVNPDKFSFEDLGIRNYSIKQAYLPFVNPDTTGDAELFYQKYNEFYVGLEQNVATMFAAEPEIRDELTARFEYDRSQYARVYDWKTRNVFAWLMNWLVEITVRHGYHGEINFILSSLLIMLLFAVIYLWKEGPAIHQFFGVFSTLDASLDRVSSRRERFFDWVIRFAKSFWVSFYIFITPKFPTRFFTFKGALFLLLLTEWVIGVFFIVLFLIYIASKYSFVRTLFGF